MEWLANIENPKTCKAYQPDVREFMALSASSNRMKWALPPAPMSLPGVKVRGTSDATVRCNLSSLPSLFEFLCDQNAVTDNPVDEVKRPKSRSSEGGIPAISIDDARKLIDAPDTTLKSKRDRALLGVKNSAEPNLRCG